MGLLKANRTSHVQAVEQSADTPRIDDPDPQVRRRAIRLLAHQGGAVTTLVGLIRDEQDSRVREAAFLELAAMNCDDAAQGVAELLSDADPARRNGALEALAAMPGPAVALLEPLGLSDDPDVRIFAVLLASELPAEETADWLIALAARDQDANVCSNVAEALGGTGRAEAVPVLEGIAARFPDEPFLAFAVETALQRLRGA